MVLRVYGSEPKVLVNRDVEAMTHEMLAARGLAAHLFARFSNGLLYAFVPGLACQLQQLASEEIWSAVAARLGEHHAKMGQVFSGSSVEPVSRTGTSDLRNDRAKSKWPEPNIWSAMQRWIDTLPARTRKQKERRDILQHELSYSIKRLGDSSLTTPPSVSIVWKNSERGL